MFDSIYWPDMLNNCIWYLDIVVVAGLDPMICGIMVYSSYLPAW